MSVAKEDVACVQRLVVSLTCVRVSSARSVGMGRGVWDCNRFSGVAIDSLVLQ